MSASDLSLDEKIQLFQSEYGPDHCYDCDPEAPYQFFSKEIDSMITFSSSWFNCEENQEIADKSSDKTLEQFNWCFHNAPCLTDIGFNDGISLFSMSKSQLSSDDIKAKIRICQKPAEQPLPLMMWKLPCEKTKLDTINSVEIGGKREISYSQGDCEFGPKKEKIKYKYNFVRKLTTSKFGRTRKVIDFSLLEDLLL